MRRCTSVDSSAHDGSECMHGLAEKPIFGLNGLTIINSVVSVRRTPKLDHDCYLVRELTLQTESLWGKGR